MKKFYKFTDKIESATLYLDQDGVWSVRFKDNLILKFFEEEEAMNFIEKNGFNTLQKQSK